MLLRNRYIRALIATFAVAIVTVAAYVPAASAQVDRRAADAHIFRPAMDGHGIFVVDRADVGKPWTWGFRFGVHFTQSPLNLSMSGIEAGEVGSPLDYSLTFHLGFHVTFTKWMALAIDVPFAKDEVTKPLINGTAQLDEKQLDYLLKLYDEEILAADRAVGRFAEALRSRDRWNETVFIVTADHGEEFFDHGSFEHGHTLYSELTRIPLIATGPGLGLGEIGT